MSARRAHDRIRGTLVGDPDDPVSVRIDLDVASDRVSCDIGPLSGESKEPPLIATDRGVRRYNLELARRIRRESARTRPPRAVPKPSVKRRRKPPVAATICPDCLGVRSFDCDRCEGAGIVPAE